MSKTVEAQVCVDNAILSEREHGAVEDGRKSVPAVCATPLSQVSESSVLTSVPGDNSAIREPDSGWVCDICHVNFGMRLVV